MIRVIADAVDADAVTVGEVATEDLHTVRPDDTLADISAAPPDR